MRCPNTSPVLALLMSIFLPSSGQFYNKQLLKGILALALYSLGILSLKYTNWLLYFIWFIIIADAVLTSIYYKVENKKEQRYFIFPLQKIDKVKT